MKALVTGAAGFIGSAVCRNLLAKGWEVRGLRRSQTDIRRLEDRAVEWMMGDITRIDSLSAAMEGCQAVIHCASLSNWKDLASPRMKEVVWGGTRNILTCARKNQLRLVYLSSASAMGASEQPNRLRSENDTFNLNPTHYRYAACKLEAENECLQEWQRHGTPCVIVNPVETYGPLDWQRVTAQTLIDFAQSPICMTCPGGTSIAHVDDVAEGVVAALLRGEAGQRYLLGGENLTVDQIASCVMELVGKRHPRLRVPRPLLRACIHLGEKLPIASLQPELMKFRYATHYWFFDHSRAQRALGLHFRSGRETLQSSLEWLLQVGWIRTPSH
jgi:dihydroflavonol-4-reductase